MEFRIITLPLSNDFYFIYSSIKSEDEYYDKDNEATKEKTIEQPEAEPTVPSQEDPRDSAPDESIDMESPENRDEESVSTEFANDISKEKHGNNLMESHKTVD